MSWRTHRLPLFLAVVVTLLNAVKPAVVDDTAYLLFARHLATDPLHPYGFELFWYWCPQPAMEILLPPVLPYWLAAGIALFGEHLFLLKLWLFPFAWILCLAVRSLLRRFAPGVESEGTIAFCLSPAVLPLFSVMLDVPALALGAAAVALFMHGCDARRWWLVPLAGLCAALAVQTKYSMLAVPPVLVAYAFTRLGRPHSVWALMALIAALVVAAAICWGWEQYLVAVHGESHFLRHFRESSGAGAGDLWEKLAERFAFAQPLFGQFGGLAAGVSVTAAAGIGWPRWVRVVAVAVFMVAVACLLVLPYSATQPLGPRYDLPFIVFGLCGVSVAVTVVMGLGRGVWKRVADADTLFLVGWVFIETLGMLGMTPFPAARRVIGVCLAVAVLLFHLVAKLGQGRPAVPRWGVAFAVGLGVLVWAIDYWDAQAEKVLAERAAAVVKMEPGPTVWYTGHWGWQYYCERAGMRPVVSQWDGKTDRTTLLKAGDWLVLPLVPRDGGFYRPHPPDPEFPPAELRLEEVTVLEWRDGLSAQTIPPMYGGGAYPFRGRNHPRLRVGVYRVTKDWRAW